MCGIVGIYSCREGRPIDARLVESMNRSIVHRGPDSAGFYQEPGRVALAMRRLSIIDVAGGDQPVTNEDRSVWVVFNGEIYNFHALREELSARGHRFKSHCDTEVIVHAYEEWGDDCVTHFRGMFAFAIWDANRRRVLLARDRVGIKQLFYTEVDGQLLWASEIKALLQHPGVARALRPAAVNHYLTYLYVPEPLTMFEGIHELQAGHVLTAERGTVTTHPYWKLRYNVNRGMGRVEAAERLRTHLDDAVRVRLLSDVPLGAFLSGGIDSAAIVALMAKHSQTPVQTFSVGYAKGGEAFDERRYARALAARYAADHREFEMRPDLSEVTSKIVRAFDQPSADSGAIPTWHLSSFVSQYVKVALSGLGGDEIAAGYERHRGAMFAERLRWIPQWVMRSVAQPLVDGLPDPRSGNQWPQRAKRFIKTSSLPFDSRFFEMMAQWSKDGRAALLTPEILEQIDIDEPTEHYHKYLREVSDADPLNRALYAELKLYLPGNLLTLTDRMSMAHSLEVRVPFLDHEVLEFASQIPPDYKLYRMDRKHVLKRAVADLLPADFLRRRKMGFTPPLSVWFRTELRDFIEDSLSPTRIRDAGVFRYETVRRIIDDHYARRANLDNQIWALVTFMTWWSEYIASPTTPCVVDSDSAPTP